MRGFSSGRFWLALALLAFLPALSRASDVVSTMRNVNAVMEAHGFRINPAFDQSGDLPAGDLSPVQAFEILRPDGKAFTIGRLYTSCVCIQLEAPKRNFGSNERAILRLRNVKPTPTNGQIYAIYVQITNPIRTTLRFDTFVQSGGAVSGGQTDTASAPAAPAIVENPADPAVYGDPGEFEVITPSSGEGDAAEKKEGEGESADETAEGSGSGESAVAAGGTEVDAIKAEAEARVEATRAAADEMAASMDSLFDELSGGDMPPALPPPSLEETEGNALPPPPGQETDSASLPPPPGSEPAPLAPPTGTPETPETAGTTEEAPSQGAIAGGVAAASGTRLEEVYQSSSSGRLAPSPAPASAPVAAPASGGKKPLRNVSLITIGVRDLARSMRFYQELGWEMSPRGKYDQTAFFQLNGQVLVLYPIPDLLKEQNMESAAPSPGGITLAIHVGNKQDVYTTYQSFIDAGGSPLKEPTEMLSGSVTSYVADPDGNPWEISWVPQFRVDENGWLWLP